jgi:hypothetical protein
MNRIILIGNGFDLAHGLKTSYTDFLNNCKEDIAHILLPLNNQFFKIIQDKMSLENWVDIENEYYVMLKSYLTKKEEDRNAAVKALNELFDQVKDLLERYLTKIWHTSVSKKESIESAIRQPLKVCDIAKSKPKREMLIKEVCVNQILMANYPELILKKLTRESDSHLSNLRIERAIFVNFNYNNTAEKLYVRQADVVINIHGELNRPSNPIIFGYGDELDEEYKDIERTQDNDFLKNIKSIQYNNTANYSKLLGFLEYEPYQVFIMGHSCGNSDRTLLNTIFENQNCISIKPFYYQWKDEETGEIKDNYTEITKNISRNFNDKQAMRDIVVNKEFCQPLVPCDSEAKSPS